MNHVSIFRCLLEHWRVWTIRHREVSKLHTSGHTLVSLGGSVLKCLDGGRGVIGVWWTIPLNACLARWFPNEGNLQIFRNIRIIEKLGIRGSRSSATGFEIAFSSSAQTSSIPQIEEVSPPDHQGSSVQSRRPESNNQWWENDGWKISNLRHFAANVVWPRSFGLFLIRVDWPITNGLFF